MVSKRQILARRRFKQEHPELFPKPDPTPPKDPNKKKKKKSNFKRKKSDPNDPTKPKRPSSKKHPLRIPGMRPGDSCFICKADNHIAKNCPEKAQWEKHKTFFVSAVIFAFSVEATLGNIACENLNKDSCAFAVSSSGKRCVLEKNIRRSGKEVFVCSTSQIDTDQVTNWIESDRCLKACGLDRNVLGISSDSLLDSRFMQKLCSTQCYTGCPNIVDLYFNLAVGEGVYLPSLCQSEGDAKRRGMSEIRSSGNVAPGPTAPAKFMVDVSPAMAPSPIGPN